MITVLVWRFQVISWFCGSDNESDWELNRKFKKNRDRDHRDWAQAKPYDVPHSGWHATACDALPLGFQVLTFY